MEKNINPLLICEVSGIFYEKNRAFKVISRHDNGIIITDSVVQQRLVVIYNRNWRKTRCLLESTRQKMIYCLSLDN